MKFLFLACLCGLAASDVLSEPNLILYYKFDETSGSVVDSSSNAYHATTFGEVTRTGGTIEVGASGYVQLPTITLADAPMTVSVRFKFDFQISATYGRIFDIGCGQSCNNVAMFRFSTFDYLDLTIFHGSTSRQQNCEIHPPSQDEWVHVVWVVDGTVAYVYQDGALLCTGPNEMWQPAGGSYNSGYLFKSNWVDDGVAAGSLDSLYIVQRAFTAEEAYAAYIADTLDGVTADPLFHTADGRSVQLHLRPGVFALWATSTLVVNALVERQVWLPPEDNQVITMLGISARSLNTATTGQHAVNMTSAVAYCDVTRGGCYSDEQSSLLQLRQWGETGMVVSNDDIEVFVRLVKQSTVDRGQGVAYASSRHLNVFITRGKAPAGGMLADLSSVGVGATKTNMADYEITGGCLFMPLVPATSTLIPAADEWARQLGC